MSARAERTARTRRTARAAGARLLVLPFSLLAACGGGDRELGRADTAVVLSDSLAVLAADSLRGDSALRDSAAGDSVADSAAAGDSLAGSPSVVLRADSIAGDVLYHGRGGCLTCHALNGAGVAGLGPSLRDSVWLHGDGSVAMIERVTREGVARPKSVSNRMPGAAGRLDESAIRRIAAYVYAISHAGATVEDTAATAPAGRDSATGDIEPEP